MGRDTGIAARLRASGLAVVEVDGWQNRGSSEFNPRGGVDHHTAGSNNGNAPSLNICTNGRSDLPGPLCNVLQGFDGTCYVIASGRANHAGDGGWRGLSGNSSVYGFERENDGTSAARPGQHESAARAWAAICSGGPFGHIPADMVCGHREWAPNRKPDFHHLDYGWLRGQIAHGPAPITKRGVDLVFYMKNPHAPSEIWVTDGMTKRHVATQEEIDLCTWMAGMQGVANIPASVGPVDVHPKAFDHIPER